MKKISLLLVILAIIALSCNNKKKVENFLFLSVEQLKPLGIDCRDNGVFYKNINPNHIKDNQRSASFAFYCKKDNYLTTIIFDEADSINANKTIDTTLSEMTYRKLDFYPLIIGNTKGSRSLDKYTVLNKEIKLLPIAIAMKNAKLTNRTDTIIVWLKPTESLKKALPESINIEDYLKVPAIEK
ncbi:MAG: hypothetical protein NTZ33_08155 [Bacteroidetes bacterium]|nr:hypothetical protein [Bacteroidota bacterium]